MLTISFRLPPPPLSLLQCGNWLKRRTHKVSSARMSTLLEHHLPEKMECFVEKRTLVESTAGSCHNARKLPKSLPNFLALNRKRKKYFLILLFLLFHPPITEHKVHQLLQNYFQQKEKWRFYIPNQNYQKTQMFPEFFL